MSDHLRRVAVLLVVLGVLVGVVPTLYSAATAEPVTYVVERPANDTIVGIQDTGHVSMYDPDGNLRWQADSTEDYFDVTPLNDSYVLAAFRDPGYRECGPYEPPCSRTGARLLHVGADGDVTVAREYSLPVRTPQSSEVHDVELLPSGKLLVADMEYERVFVTDWDGDVEWTWNASSYYEAPPDPTREDWLHINDVDRIAPGRYLVSVRNANQVLVVTRGEGVTEVINADGDPSLFYEQHNPQWLGDGHVLLADSENDRIVELRRDEATGRWEHTWSIDSAGGYHFDWPRDADRLPNGNTLVSDTRNQRVLEITESGRVVWSRRLPANVYEADRLPGERVYEGDAPLYDSGEQTTDAVVLPQVPLFSLLRSLASYKLPIPIWFTGFHLFCLTLGGLLAALGVGVGYRDELRSRLPFGRHA
ncbi:MAG: hypothetical protein ABEJ06_04565 [Haloarculaceae archaeon]